MQQVPCVYSTPSHPSNLDLAPADNYCLIPTEVLKANTTYRVEVTSPGDVKSFRFTTGR